MVLVASGFGAVLPQISDHAGIRRGPGQVGLHFRVNGLRLRGLGISEGVVVSGFRHMWQGFCGFFVKMLDGTRSGTNSVPVKEWCQFSRRMAHSSARRIVLNKVLLQ